MNTPIITILACAIISTSALAQNNEKSNIKDTVSLCDAENVYAGSDLAVNFETYKNLKKAEKNAVYPGKETKLAHLLNEYLDLDVNDVKETTVPVTVAFTINCQGEAGGYTVQISEEIKNAEAYRESIVKALNSLPEEWMPAEKNGNTVDSQAMMMFSLKLDKDGKGEVKDLGCL